MPSKVSKLPKKLNKTKTVHVREHERLLYAREYYIVCKKCRRSVSRESFGACPLYCLECRPPKSQNKSDPNQKKLPRPVLVQTEAAAQEQGNIVATR